MGTSLDLNDPIAVLLEVLRALRAEQIAAATYGGLALAVYGAPRETKDADVAVSAVDPPRVERALKTAGFDASMAFERVRFGGNRVTRVTLLPGEGQAGLNTADFVEPLSVRFAEDVLRRAIAGTLRGQSIRVVTPEDFVLLKVLSTRARDLEDAATVVTALGATIDAQEIEAEAARLALEIPDHDVLGRLRRVFESAQ